MKALNAEFDGLQVLLKSFLSEINWSLLCKKKLIYAIVMELYIFYRIL